MYLLEETEEAYEMRQKLRSLLLSHDEAQVILALQLMETGGYHTDFVAPLCIQFSNFLYKSRYFSYAQEKENKEIAAKLLDILEKILTPKQYKDVRKNIRHGEALVTHIHKDCKLMKPYHKDIVKCAFAFYKKGGAFCYKNNILSADFIFGESIDSNGRLDLTEYDLQFLPDELAGLSMTTLDLGKNNILIYPKNWKNNFVRYFIPPDNLSRQDIKILRQCFPNWEENHFLSQGFRIIDKEGRQAYNEDKKLLACALAKEGLSFLRYASKGARDLVYYYMRGIAYHILGKAAMVYVCFEHIRQTYKEVDYAFAFYDMARNYSLLGKTTEMLHFITKHILQIGKKIDLRKITLSVPDFESYKRNKNMLYYLDMYEEITDLKEFEEAVTDYLQ